MIDLLSAAEIDALLKRLALFPTGLTKRETRLLDPDDWQHHLDAVINEEKATDDVTALKCPAISRRR